LEVEFSGVMPGPSRLTFSLAVLYFNQFSGLLPQPGNSWWGIVFGCLCS